MKISISIPTYECYGFGWLYFSELLNSIFKQTYKNYEVVISDQSSDKNIKNLVNYYSQFMDIMYLDGRKFERKISPNINNATKHCTGDIIKYMCGDDFFIDDGALDKIKNAFSVHSGEWLIMGTLHCNSIHQMHTRMIPFYHDKIHLGANTISSPSVLATRNKQYLDDNLSMLVDCELYKRLYVNYGSPMVIQDPLVCNRIHEHQQQKSLQEVVEKEKSYCVSLYGE